MGKIETNLKPNLNHEPKLQFGIWFGSIKPKLTKKKEFKVQIKPFQTPRTILNWWTEELKIQNIQTFKMLQAN